MQIKMFKTLWGMPGEYEQQLERIAQAGYNGVEWLVPPPEKTMQFKELLEQYNLEYIPMIYTDGDHKATYRERLERALEFQPKKVNSHSAKDWMSLDEQKDFFEFAMKTEQQLGITVAHETHRSRATYSAWNTAKLLQEFPEMRLTADFSHWVVVSESLLEDQMDNVRLAMERTIHLHTRVGFRHGPQVPDPRAPEYALELEEHARWWDEIYHIYLARGEKEITIDPEFGPPGYMHTLPYTKQPVSDLWDVCLWMAGYNRERLSQISCE